MAEKDKPYQPSLLSPDGTRPDSSTVTSLRMEELKKYLHNEEQLSRGLEVSKSYPDLSPLEIFQKMAQEDSLDGSVNDAHSRNP